MKYVLACMMVACLSAPAYAQSAEAEIESVTGREWSGAAPFTVYTANGDSAIAIGDSLWTATDGDVTWVRCMTEPDPFTLDSLQAVAKRTLDGRSALGINGPLHRMTECVTTFRAVLEAVRP